MPIHTAKLNYKGDEFYFISDNGETFVEVSEEPTADNKTEAETLLSSSTKEGKSKSSVMRIQRNFLAQKGAAFQEF